MRERGGEFGTTTGRPRRSGWLDLVALRYAARLNGMTALAITKLDVLSGLRHAAGLHAATAARDGAVFDDFPYHQSVLHHVDRRVRRAARLERGHHRRAAARTTAARRRDYLRFIEDFVGVPIALVGVGPGRDQIVFTGERSPLLPPAAPSASARAARRPAPRARRAPGRP